MSTGEALGPRSPALADAVCPLVPPAVLICGWLSRAARNAVTYEPTTAVISGDEAALARQEAGE